MDNVGGRVRCSRVRDKGSDQMKRASDWRLSRVDVYTDLYRWIVIEMKKIRREAMHSNVDSRWIDGVDTASGCGAKPHTVPIL
jgi:hypothetical protein